MCCSPQSQVTLYAASCVICMQSYLSHKTPSHSKEFFFFLSTKLTNDSFLMKAGLKLMRTCLSWAENRWTRYVCVAIPVRKWTSHMKISGKAVHDRTAIKNGCSVSIFLGGRIAKNWNWQLNPKHNPRYMCCRITCQTHNPSTVSICWSLNTQWCFHLTSDD